MNLKLLNYSLINVDKTDSTNTLLSYISANQTLKPGQALIADHQTNGRGQRGNLWRSEKGRNLTFSVYLKPQIKVSDAFYLNIISALAIHHTLDKIGINSKIKWPNDILVDNSKIAGILVENQLSGQNINESIIGIGLNVNQILFENLLKATSIKSILHKSYDKTEIMKLIYEQLDFYYNLLIQSSFDNLLKIYLKNLYKIDEKSLYQDKTGEFTGIIRGIDKIGKLIIEKENRSVQHYNIQEIKFY